ncbi:hypothetical protein LA080_011624 [Diaporthe eres]|nr:hypothetical protein LA080_011624 [Diaporthe eres]
MASKDLRKNLAKANFEKQHLHDQSNKSPLEDPNIWAVARKAFAEGFQQPELRFYVVISPTSPVSTPEKLQQLTKMTSAPKMQEDGKPQNVKVGEVSWDKLEEIKGKTEYELALFIWINKKVRGALMVKGFKNVTAEDQ